MDASRNSQDSPSHILVGGGIASLAAAALLIREAGVDGRRIRILEHEPVLGGSLDGSGNAYEGFLTRGGRMFEQHFACTLDLFDSIPSADDPSRSVTEDIAAFNREIVSAADCRLVRNARKAANRHHMLLRMRDKAALARLMLAGERGLGGRTIESWFGEPFFASNFWLLWSTMFSFTPWHSLVEMRRYMRRFIHLFPGLSRLRGVLRTRYDQYDALVLPLQDWLAEHGVTFVTGNGVRHIAISGPAGSRRVTGIELEDGQAIPVGPGDQVYITLGSMTDASSLGSNTSAPPRDDQPGPSWRLWLDLARCQPDFGNPLAFCGDPARTAWHSFTVTLDHPRFHAFMEQFSGNATGTGGLVTFADSGWLLSIVLAHQPHFRNQPEGTYVFWGYGLRGERPGDAVRKPMWEASGDEILDEMAHHLGLGEARDDLLGTATIRTCRMPFITSQFMPRHPGDRPQVRPPGAQNFALIGQFCEMERDCAFTVEYSVRSAWQAVRAMNGQCRPPPPVVRTDLQPLTVFRAARHLVLGG